MTPFPYSLKIGSALYRVNYITRKEADDRKINGECKPNERIIDVQEDLPFDLKTEVLLHEALHASFYESQITDLPSEKLTLNLSSPEGHEFFVAWTAAAVQRLIVDNPIFLGLYGDLLAHFHLVSKPSP